MTAEETPDLALDEATRHFVAHRPKLYSIALRTLGSPWSADDAVQETWLRLSRADIDRIENLEAWLTTVVSRVCVDLLRQRTARPEDPDADIDIVRGGETGGADTADDPAGQLMRAEDLSLALQVVVDELAPVERLALVLHDVFALSFEDIAPIVERSPAAARQLASRARRRLQTVDVRGIRARRGAAIDAFLSAARNGDFGELLRLLDPEIRLRSDETAVQSASAGADFGAPLLADSIRGADAVARVFAGRAQGARLVLLDGIPAAAYIAGGAVRAVYLIEFRGGRIARLDVIADPDRLAGITAQSS